MSAQPSRQGTPGPSTPGTATPAAAASTKAEAVKPKPRAPEKANNTTTVTVDAQFMAAADDLFGLLTDEKRIPSWTRAPTKVRADFLLYVQYLRYYFDTEHAAARS